MDCWISLVVLVISEAAENFSISELENLITFSYVCSLKSLPTAAPTLAARRAFIIIATAITATIIIIIPPFTHKNLCWMASVSTPAIWSIFLAYAIPIEFLMESPSSSNLELSSSFIEMRLSEFIRPACVMFTTIGLKSAGNSVIPSIAGSIFVWLPSWFIIFSNVSSSTLESWLFIIKAPESSLSKLLSSSLLSALSSYTSPFSVYEFSHNCFSSSSINSRAYPYSSFVIFSGTICSIPLFCIPVSIILDV